MTAGEFRLYIDKRFNEVIERLCPTKKEDKKEENK